MGKKVAKSEQNSKILDQEPHTKRLEPKSVKMNEASSFYRELIAKEETNSSFKALQSHINNGENYLRQTSRIEVKEFDSAFIDEMEEGLKAVEKIVNNPRTFIKEENELVQVGLAKKISTLSVRHFATHSHLIRNIDDNGDVIPEKILTIHAETDAHIYENRFIMTLIRRCIAFIQTRYNFVIEHGETYDSDLLLLHNTTQIDGVKYEVDSRIKVSTPSLEEGKSESNEKILQRLTDLRDRCMYFMSSPFMNMMKGAREVSSPIHMTNMIVKHPDYHRAYELWEFLDNYEDLGVKFDVKEFEKELSSEYKKELSSYITNSILAIHSNRVNKETISKINYKKYNPQVIFTLEDVTYADSRFLYDAYPEAKTSRLNPLAPLPSEVRAENEKFNQVLKNQRSAKVNLDKAILDDKDRIVYEEALKRVEKQRLLNEERKHYIDYALSLEKENAKLKDKNEKTLQNATILATNNEKLANENKSLNLKIKELEKELASLKKVQNEAKEAPRGDSNAPQEKGQN